MKLLMILSSKNEADVVYPYGDGDYQIQVFADDDLVTDFPDSMTLIMTIFKVRVISMMRSMVSVNSSVGKAYIEGGMENENFIAYAPEDVERYHRFVKLGYRVVRISKCGVSFRT